MTEKIKAELNNQLKAAAVYMSHLNTWDERRDVYNQACGMANFAVAIDTAHLSDYEKIWAQHEPTLNDIVNGWVWE